MIESSLWVIWFLLALENIKVKGNIAIERNWLSAEWGGNVCSTPDVVSWALKSGLISFLKLEDGELPTFEDLVLSNGELFWVAPVLLS